MKIRITKEELEVQFSRLSGGMWELNTLPETLELEGDEVKENGILYCDRQEGLKGKNCKCICHQKDYSLPDDFPKPQPSEIEELKLFEGNLLVEMVYWKIQEKINELVLDNKKLWQAIKERNKI